MPLSQPRPTAAFQAEKLRLVQAGDFNPLVRLYPRRYSDPLGFARTASRFSDGTFGVVYASQAFSTAFLEVVVRDLAVGVPGPLDVPESLLSGLVVTELHCPTPIHLADLREPVAVRVPTDVVRGSVHDPAWARAIHDNAAAPEGIVYPSRLDGYINIGVYEHKCRDLVPGRTRPLLDHPELGKVLDRYGVALLPV